MKRKYEFSKEGLKIGDILKAPIDRSRYRVIEVLESIFFYEDNHGVPAWETYKTAIDKGWNFSNRLFRLVK